MKKAIITILALVMILSAVSVSVSANTGTVSFDQIVKSACNIIRENEGYYYSVAANDNGALSIGWIQWHGNRALSLLRDIVIRDTATAKTILGDTLYDEIMTTSSWASRTLTSDESKRISNLIRTDIGKEEQDRLAYADVSVYVNHGLRVGISDPAALVYFADIENQHGAGGSGRVGTAAIALAGSGAGVTLEVIYKAALADSSVGNTSRLVRRNKTYNKCLLLGWSLSTVRYEIWTSTASVNARSAPNTDSKINTTISTGVTVAVTEKYLNETSCWGKTYLGWVLLKYFKYQSGSLPTPVAFDVNGGNPFEKPKQTASINGVNVQRLADYAVVYNRDTGLSTAPTNEFGYEFAVDQNGKVITRPVYGSCMTEIPKGGFVVSAIGSKNEWIRSVSIGDFVRFDSVMNTVYVYSSDESGKKSYEASTKNLEFGKKYWSLPSPERYDYIFQGWYTDKTGGTRVTADSILDSHVSPVLYAHWVKREKRNVFFNTDGGYFKEEKKASVDGVNSPRGNNMLVVYNSGERSNTNQYGTEVAIGADGKVLSAPVYGASQTAIPDEGFVLSGHGTASDWMLKNISRESYVKFDASTVTISVYERKSDYDLINKSVKQGYPIGSLPNPEKEYYEFLGWYGADGKQVGPETIMPMTELKLSAKWKVLPGDLTFELDGGTVSGRLAGAMLSGTNTSRLANDLIRYSGKASTGTNKYGTEALIGSDGTVLFIYPAETGNNAIPSGTYVLSGNGIMSSWLKSELKPGYYVRIDGDNVSVYESRGNYEYANNKKVTCGSEYGALPKVFRSGFYFAGWIDSGMNKVTETSKVASYGNVILTALWEKNATVSFDTAGGSIKHTAVPASLNAINKPRESNALVMYIGMSATPTNDYGSEAIVGPDGRVTAVYKYKGKNTVPKGSYALSGHGSADAFIRDNIAVGSYVVNSGRSITVYRSYLSYCAETGKKAVFAGEKLGRYPLASKENYELASWTSPEGLTENSIVSDDTVLTASWRITKQKVVFDTAGGDFEPRLASAAITAKNTARSNNSLVLYKGVKSTGTDGNGTEALIGPDGIVRAVVSGAGSMEIPESYFVLSGSGTLSRWICENLKPGCYINMNGSTVEVYSARADYAALKGAFTVNIGEKFGPLPSPVRDGYIFSGWKKTTGGKVSENDIVPEDRKETLTLQAVWSPKVQITFDTDGGSLDRAPRAVITAVNSLRTSDALVLYVGKASTGTNAYGTEAVVGKDGTVTAVRGFGNGNSAVPSGGFVLSGHGSTADFIQKYIKVGCRVAIANNLVYIYNAATPEGISGEGVEKSAAIINGTNTQRSANTLIKYTSSVSDTNNFGTEIAVDSNGNIVAVYSAKGKNPVPSGGFILSGHGTKAAWLSANARTGCFVIADGSIAEIFESKEEYLKSISVMSVAKGSSASTLPSASKQYHTFEGWSAGGTAITGSYVFSADTILKARYKVCPVNITFNTAGGSIPAPAKQSADGENVMRTADTLVVYKNKATTGTNNYGTEVIVGSDGRVTAINGYGKGNSTIPSGGFVLSGHDTKAKWLTDNIRVGYTVIVNGSSIAVYRNAGDIYAAGKTVDYGSPIGLLPVPVRSGYVFDSWKSAGGKIYTSSTAVTDFPTVALTAVWKSK